MYDNEKKEKPKIEMPKIRPVPIHTKDKNFFAGLFLWLTTTRNWELLEDYILLFGGKRYIVPKGFVFDGASIPKVFRFLLSPTGILFIPALFHDFAYKYKGYMVIINKNEHDSLVFLDMEKRQIDKIFREMGYFVNGIRVPNYIAYFGVQFGYFVWKKHRKNNKKVCDIFPFYVNA